MNGAERTRTEDQTDFDGEEMENKATPCRKFPLEMLTSSVLKKNNWLWLTIMAGALCTFGAQAEEPARNATEVGKADQHTATQEPRFSLAYGKSQPLCEAYFKLINQTRPKKPLPVCDLKLDRLPDVKQPAWEELNIEKNLDLVHQIEWQIRTEFKPEPEFDFEKWRKQLQRRMKNPINQPRLKRVRMVFEEGQPADWVYGYEINRKKCDPARVSTWANYPGMHFFLYDEKHHKLRVLPILPGEFILYEGQPIVVSSGLTDKTHFWMWRISFSKLANRKFLKYEDYAWYDSTSGVCLIDAAEMFGNPYRH